MPGFSWSFALSLLALACSGMAILLAASRTPSGLARTALKEAQGLHARWVDECKLFEATRDRWSQEFAGIADRCDETLERAESKRRRVAATESRNSQAPHPQELTREQVIEAARRRMLGGH